MSFSETVLRKIIRLYTREAGVRGLEKAIVKICRKTASAVTSRRKPPGRLKIADLGRLLG